MPVRRPAESAAISKQWAAIPTHDAAWRWARPVHGMLILSLLLGLKSPLVMAQDAQTPADLMDIKIEDLLKIEIDSVYGASKFKQKVTEAPASVTIITSEDIRKYGYRTLADILRNVRGFYVTYDRNYSFLGVRGYGRPGDYNSRIKVLVDGHLLNENVYDSALLGTEFPIDVDLIDRVEVIRGPNSSLYVASAFLGVINIITKRGRDARNVSASGELASYGTYRGRVSYGNRFGNGLEVLLSGSFYSSQGPQRLFFQEFDSPDSNHGIAINADDDQSQQLFANVMYGRFTFHGVYGSRDKGIPTASFGTVFNDPRNRTVDARGYFDVEYERELSHGWLLASRASFDKYNYQGTYVYDYSASGGPDRVLNKDFAYGSWMGGEVTLSRKILDRHRLTVGSEYRNNFQQDQGNYDVQPSTSYLDDRRNSYIVGLYAQDEVRLRRNLVLNLGLRYDHYSTFGGTTNPRAALIYNPRERTTIKFLYAQAFRAPNFYELYYQAPGSEPNPSLRPETVKTVELVWEQYFANHFRLGVSGFYYPIRGLINAQTDPITGSIIYLNADQVDIRGLDLVLRRRLPWGLEGGITYSFQDAKNANPETPLTNSPKHLGQASLSLPLVKQKLFASMNLPYVSRRRTLSGNYTGAYAVPNFTLFSRGLLKGLEISASVYNVFNHKYGDPGGQEHLQDIIFQDGRNFRVKVGYNF